MTENTATLIDHVFTNSPHKITQSGVIDDKLIYCMRKTTKWKSNKHNELNICSMKNYTAKNFVEHLKNIDFPNYKAYSCVNMAYLDFISKLTDVIDSLCPSKKIRIKGNTKPWFDSEVILMVNKRDKDIFRTTNNFLKTTIEKKKRMSFKTSYRKIRKVLKKYGKPWNL